MDVAVYGQFGLQNRIKCFLSHYETPTICTASRNSVLLKYYNVFDGYNYTIDLRIVFTQIK